MKFYEVAIIGRKAPLLIYQYKDFLESGVIVSIKLQRMECRGVILKEVAKPLFKCETLNPLEEILSPLQRECARFITSYYLTSPSLSYSLFTPFCSKYSLLPLERDFQLKPLSQAQNEALEFLNTQKQSLLFGDTGSGKTEIYTHLIANALKQNQTVLFLMPEISLTPQMESRLSAYFGDLLAFWHSKITNNKKQKILHRIHTGEVRIVAGARSAFFLPLQNLGLIIVDEEHDDAYKNTAQPHFNVRDLALFLAHKYAIKVVLGSGTPLATSYFLAQKNKTLFRLKGTHFNAGKKIVFTPPSNDSFLAQKTLELILQTIENKKQILVFVPTRANFKHLLCNKCGNSIQCPNCSVSMSVYHKKNALICHYCYATAPIPQCCQICGGELKSLRFGTAEIIKFLKGFFENKSIEVHIAQFDREAITTQKQLETTLGDFNYGKIDILVGTQMLSKGHDYHNVALCVILGIDYLLKGEDYRSRERAVSLLNQLCGRTGRKEEGIVAIETFYGEFFAPFLKDYEVFLQEELSLREGYYPPFTRLALIRFSGKSEERTVKELHKALELLQSQKNTKVEIIGYGIAPIAKIAQKWRYLIFIRANRSIELLQSLNILLPYGYDIDIDPTDFS